MRFARFSGALPSPVPGCAASGPPNVVSNHYDASGRLDCEYDQLGRETTCAYTTDANHNVTSTTVTDPAAHATLDTFAGG